MARPSTDRHQLVPRRATVRLEQSPLQWLPGDPLGSHMINGIHLILPAGELWFCRVFNRALPLVQDEQLARDVRGFIRQEAYHAQAHRKGEAWLARGGVDVEAVTRRMDLLFGKLLDEYPLGSRALGRLVGERRWLVLRVGLIAAIEHYTGMLGDWCLNSQGWDAGDAQVADLFRWHLAEEVEHRCVAFDLFQYLCRTQLGFYLSRQVCLAVVFPVFIGLVLSVGREMARQDQDPAARRQVGRRSLLALLWEFERVGRQRDTVPTFTFVLRRSLRWIAPGFHPQQEGNTRQALDYIARSPTAGASVPFAQVG